VKVQVVLPPEDIGNDRKNNISLATKLLISKSEDIGKMTTGKSYKLAGMWVRGAKYLATAKTECHQVDSTIF
jgi:hypothetical protein